MWAPGLGQGSKRGYEQGRLGDERGWREGRPRPRVLAQRIELRRDIP